MPDDDKPVPAAPTEIPAPGARPVTYPAQDMTPPEAAPVILTAPAADAPHDPPPDLRADPLDAPARDAVPARTRPARGFAAPLLGGALAAVLGFGLSHYDILNLRTGIDPALLNARLAEIEQQQRDGLAATQAAAEKAGADASAALAAAAEPPAALADLTARVDALDTALREAATSGADGAPAALAALSAELDQLRATIAAQPAGDATDADAIRRIVDESLAAWEGDAAARIAAEAESAKVLALRDAALLSLREATVTGAPYGAALAALALPDIPEVLTRHAETGLPTATDLAASYPDAARRALDASLRVTAGGGVGDKLWAFLRIQTGARSLTPQEGEDPDSILSRVEAALAADDLPAALALIDSLPPEGQAELADWTAQARDLIAARDAIAALSPGAAAPATP